VEDKQPSWPEHPIAVFDLETTGPDPTTARIVTATIAVLNPDGSIGDTRTWLVDPGIEIPDGATAVHGITTAHATEHGTNPGIACRGIETVLAAHWAAGIPVCAYNASYDLTVLDRELRRHNGHGLVVGGPVLDPYVVDREVDKYRRGSRTLTAACAHYGVSLESAHDATADAVAAGMVAYAIAARYPDISGMTLPALHTAQSGWHRDRQADFAAYLQRVGKPADDVCGDWPIRATTTERTTP
jgi:DNA polymerase-3 subunit epsilon